MSIFAFFSAGLLAAILFWAIYHLYILFAGIRSKPKHFYNNIDKLPKVSIIVPAKDEGAVIARCLEALLNMDYPRERMEIIIVEGDSKDATREICSEFSKKYHSIVRVLRECASKGKPRALNLALPHITGEIVGVFDADSVPERDALLKIASYFQNQSVMAVQGRVTSLNEKRNMLTRVAAMEEKAWFQVLLRGRERLRLFMPLTGSCQFVRREVLEELGGWDESSLAEDVELALRLVERGHSVRYAPDVCSWQETPSGLGDLVTQRTRWYRGYMEVALKYGKLLKKHSVKAVDAEISLIGPYMMVLCIISYFNWALSLFFFPETGLVAGFATLVITLTAVTLFSVGIALVFMERPVRLRNIVWVPFIYLYWSIEMVIAGWAFLQILFRRRRVWRKTVKRGFMTMSFTSDGELC